LGSIIVSPIYKWLWNSNCLPKRKVFFWLALKDRLSTRELLKRKEMELQSYNCVLCHQDVEESLHHLFMDCLFAKTCWNMLGLAYLIQGSMLDSVPLFRAQINRPFFMEVIVAMFWAIWSARNDVIFRNLHHSVQRCKMVFKQELVWVKLRSKRDIGTQLQL